MKRLLVVSTTILLLLIANLLHAETYLMDNFEHGLLSLGDRETSNGTHAISTEQAHSGSNSIKVNITSDGGYALGNKYLESAGLDTIYVRIWVYITSALVATMGNGDYIDLFYGESSDYDEQFYVTIYDTGGTDYIRFLWDGGNGSDTGLTMVSADTWHCFEVYIDHDGAAGTANLWIDGVLVSENTNEDTGAKTTFFLQIGAEYDSSGVTGAIYYDDLVIDTSRYIGTGWRVQQDGAVGSSYHN